MTENTAHPNHRRKIFKKEYSLSSVTIIGLLCSDWLPMLTFGMFRLLEMELEVATCCVSSAIAEFQLSLIELKTHIYSKNTCWVVFLLFFF